MTSKFKPGDKVVINSYAFDPINGYYWGNNNKEPYVGMVVNLEKKDSYPPTSDVWWQVLDAVEKPGAGAWIWPQSCFTLVKDMLEQAPIADKIKFVQDGDLVFFRTPSHSDMCMKCAAPLPCNYHP